MEKRIKGKPIASLESLMYLSNGSDAESGYKMILQFDYKYQMKKF